MLDEEAKLLIEEHDALRIPPLYQRDLQVARRNLGEAAASIPKEPVAAIRRVLLDVADVPIKVRIYRSRVEGLLPVMIYLHGGNWVLGDLDSHDVDCRSLANRAECAIASLDYPLAPEHPFPAAIEAVYAAAKWLAINGRQVGIDPERIGVGGASAGGNLAAALCLMARDRGAPALVCQVLIYPVTDCGLNTASYDTFGEGYLLTRESMRWSWEQYVKRPADRSLPYASPLRASTLERLPAAFVLVAGCDPLRDEGAAYAARLAAEGVSTTLVEYEGLVHTFYSMPHRLESARRAHDDTAQFLRDVFGIAHPQPGCSGAAVGHG